SIGLNVGLSNSDLAATGSDQEDGGHQVATVQLSTHSEPFENLFYDSLMTAIYDDDADGDDTTTRLSFQGISTVQWRPEDHPFIVTGTLRTLTEKIDRESDDGSSDSETKLAAATLGLRWPVDDQFSFSLGLRGSYEDIKRDEGGVLGEDAADDGQRIDAGFTAGANYISEQRDLAGFDWRWDARASADNGFNSGEGLTSSETIGLGHRFERMLEDVIFVPVRFSFTQDASLSFAPSGEEPYSATLSDSIIFNYSGVGDASSTFAGLSLRDSRNLIGEQTETQTIQARIGRRVAISRDRRLQGDLSAQAARQVSESETDITVTATGDFGYSHRNLFGIENLGLRSDLRVNVVNLDELFGLSSDETSDEFLRNDWRNILSYRIGRVTASLETSVFQQDGGVGYLALMRLRRDFGGIQ
ncbi:MAG: hypothetical protein ACE5EU_16540, partial [Paracoccaceae bacterium]